MNGIMLSWPQSKLNQPPFPYSEIIGINVIPDMKLDSKPDTKEKNL